MAKTNASPLLVLTLAAVVLAGPATVFAFLLGGAMVGGLVILLLALVFTAIYMLAVRRHG